MGKVLILVGLVLAGIGAALTLGFPLGRLPGDFVLRRSGMTVFVPLASSLLVSVVLSLLLMAIRR